MAHRMDFRAARPLSNTTNHNNKMTIAEVLAAPPGVKIEPFHATVQFVNPRKSANAPQHLKIQDATGSVKLAVWKRPDIYDTMKGKPVLIIGGETKDNFYNGKTTREVHLNPDGSFEESQGSVSTRAAATTPQTVEADRTAPQNEGLNALKVNGSSGKRPEEFCQGFIHDAVQIQLEAYKKGELELDHFGSTEFPILTKRIASDLVRVCKDIGEGKLSPPVKEREELVAGKDKVIQAAEDLFTGEQEA